MILKLQAKRPMVLEMREKQLEMIWRWCLSLRISPRLIAASDPFPVGIVPSTWSLARNQGHFQTFPWPNGGSFAFESCPCLFLCTCRLLDSWRSFSNFLRTRRGEKFLRLVVASHAALSGCRPPGGPFARGSRRVSSRRIPT